MYEQAEYHYQTRRHSIPLISIILATTLLCGMNATAQTLEEIIVTAQHREQNLQDVGISVSALTGDQMRELGMFKSTMLADYTPGVMLVQPNSRQSYGFAIRGVLQNDFADHQEHPTAIYLDEAYISQASGAGFQLFDLERVEVMRGPQGSLWGRNATGGAVSFTSVKPSQEFDAFLEMKVGSFNNRGFEGAIGGAMSENVSGRISAMGNWHDPYVKNRAGPDIFDDNTYSLRGQLLFDINDDVSLLINARVANSDNLDGGAATEGADYDPVTEFGYLRGEDEIVSNPLAGDEAEGLLPSIDCPGCDYFGHNEPDNDPFTIAHDEIGMAKLETSGFGARLDVHADSFDFVSITDYATVKKQYFEDSDNTPTPILDTFIANDADQFSQEFRFSGETENLRWVAGAYYLKIDGDYGIGITLRSAIESIGTALTYEADALLEWELTGPLAADGSTTIPCFGTIHTDLTDTCGSQVTSHGPGILVLSSFWEQKTESTSVFAQTEFDLSDNLRLTTGLRLIQEEKTIDYRHLFEMWDATADGSIVNREQHFWGELDPAAYLYIFNKDSAGNLAKYDELLWSGKIGLDIDIDDDTLAYFSINRGVKGGGFNASAEGEGLRPEQVPIKEEILTSYEAGFKRTLMDNSLRLNGSAFFYDYDDHQAFIFEGQTNLVVNRDAEIKGFELELEGSPSRGLNFQAGVAYLDAVAFALNFPAFPEPLDRRMPKTPKWQLNGLVSYEWLPSFEDSDFAGRFAVSVDANYRSDFNFLITEAPIGEQDAYTLVNARASYRSIDERWEVALQVHNVFDQFYATQIFDVATDFASQQTFVDRPRWVNATMRFNF
jgi:iron complex outermembrane receptor protein